MQNFGRGMWRRVGDYERIHVPNINKNNELQHYLALMEYHKQQRLKQNFNAYRQQMMQRQKDIVSNKDLLVQQTNINENIPIDSEEVVSHQISKEVVKEVVNEEVVSLPELTNIVPRKIKKKNKK